MLSTPIVKNECGENNSNEATPKQVRLVRGQKPLQKYKFYLDVVNYVTAKKIQSKISDLGGAVELFLVREVNIIVSDRLPEWYQSPKSIGCGDTSNDSVSPAFNSPSFREPRRISVANQRPKTRTDAMLQRARLLSTHNSLDPLENARLWRIPIWSVEKILKWLEKVSASIVLPKEELCLQNGKSCIKAANKETELKPPFIKFEPFNRNARPVYRQIPAWPVIDSDVAPGESPFRAVPERFKTEIEGSSTMRRKTRSRVRERRAAAPPQPGYCEICRVEYVDLAKHTRSDEHNAFVRNDDNYLSLDSLIAAGASVEAFLRLNGAASTEEVPSTGPVCRRSARNSTVSLEIRCNGDCGSPKNDKRSTVIDGGGTPRITRSSSACEKAPKETPAPMSPASSDPGHRLRSRGQLWLPSNLLGTTAEDDGNPAKPGPKESAKHENEHEPDENGIDEYIDERNNEKEKPIRRITTTTDVDETVTQRNVRHPKDKRRCSTRTSVEKSDIRGRGTPSLRIGRVSEDRERISENKTYYKVEVLGSKSRQSVTDLRDLDEPKMGAMTRSATANNGTYENSSCATDRLVVKFKRVRRSELSVLSDEAENFMFPRRDESSSENDDRDTDDERGAISNVSNESKYDENAENKKSKNNIDETDDASSSATEAGSHGSTASCQNGKKRRRTHAELFINDNQKYYKFETPGSRLRFQGSFLPLITGHETSGSTTCVKEEQKESCKNIKVENGVEEEEGIVLPPIDRLVYSFERLTKSEPIFHQEIIMDYSRFSDTNRLESFTMPYEMKSLPALDPRICKEVFEKRLDNQVEPEFTNSEPTKPVESCIRFDPTTGVISRRRKKRRFVTQSSGRNPRKSPRQHASTLAILSLLQQRKRRGDKNKFITSSETTDPLPSIPEENEEMTTSVKIVPVESSGEPVVETNDIEKIVREFDQVLAQEPVLSDEIPIGSDDNDCFSKEIDIVNLIGTYSECTAMEDSVSDIFPRRRGCPQAGSPLFMTRGVRKKMKRKNNRTGWPKKRRFNKRGSDKSEQCDDNESDVIAVSEKCAGSVESDICDVASRDCSEVREVVETVQTSETCNRTRNRERCKSNEHINAANESNHEKHTLDSSKYNDKSDRNCVRTDKKGKNNELSQDDHSSTLPANSKDHRAGNSVNVDLEKWENAEKMLSAKYIDSPAKSDSTDISGCESRRTSSELQPIVRVQKLNVVEISHKRRLRNSSSPARSTPAKRMRRDSPIYKNHSRSWRDR